MKLIFNTLVITLISAMLMACATKSNPWEHLSELEYRVNTYQPPCQRVTQTNGYGAVVGQYTQCPQVQYYCTLNSTGQRIQCPKFNIEKHNQAYKQLDYALSQETCAYYYNINRNLRAGEEPIKMNKVVRNSLCDEYGNPNPR